MPPEGQELLGIVTARAADFSRKAADDLYANLLEATQDYLIDNARFNIGEKIDAANRQARHDREAWGKAEARNSVLLGVLKEMAEGWANAIELKIIAPQHMAAAIILRDKARSALSRSQSAGDGAQDASTKASSGSTQ